MSGNDENIMKDANDSNQELLTLAKKVWIVLGLLLSCNPLSKSPLVVVGMASALVDEGQIPT